MTAPAGVRRVATLLRWTLGLVLLATGVGKLLDVRGFAEILRSYQVLPDPSLRPLAAVIPIAELALAFWLFSGQRPVGAGAASAAMHLTYAAWSAVALTRGLSLSNCGCFGVFLARPLTGQTVVEDLVMVALSVVLVFCARGLREAG